MMNICDKYQDYGKDLAIVYRVQSKRKITVMTLINVLLKIIKRIFGIFFWKILRGFNFTDTHLIVILKKNVLFIFFFLETTVYDQKGEDNI